MAQSRPPEGARAGFRGRRADGTGALMSSIAGWAGAHSDDSAVLGRMVEAMSGPRPAVELHDRDGFAVGTTRPALLPAESHLVENDDGHSRFWLTDDNLGLGAHTEGLCEEILKRDLDGVTWFTQLRCDDIVKRMDIIPKLREAGNVWVLLGFDSPHPGTLKKFRRDGVDKPTSKKAVEILRVNDIFSQGTFIIGERRDSEQSIEELMEYADWLDPDIATFMALTPFPGTDVYAEAKENGWIEDTNWSHYDMIHAIMPTEHLTRNEVQESLYRCYQKYFGSWPRRYRGILSENHITRRTYHYLAKKAILTGLRSLF